jgi:hypothetical protein
MLRVVEVRLSVKGLTRTVDAWGPLSLSGSGLLHTRPDQRELLLSRTSWSVEDQ